MLSIAESENSGLLKFRYTWKKRKEEKNLWWSLHYTWKRITSGGSTLTWRRYSQNK